MADYKPPKTDYQQKEALLQDITEMKEKMSFHKDTYNAKLKLLSNLDILKHRRSSLLMVFLLCIIFRVSLTDEESILYTQLVANLSAYNSIKFTIVIVSVLPLLYLILHKILVLLKKKRYQKELTQREAELIEIYNQYGICPISYKYAVPHLVEKIESLILDGRADTVKEAINLMITDEHDAKLIEYQEQIAKSSKQTALATTISAFFSWRTATWTKRNYKSISKE